MTTLSIAAGLWDRFRRGRPAAAWEKAPGNAMTASPLGARCPEFLDIVIALLAPGRPLARALLIAAIAIKLGSRGPVFYRQRRVGLDGEEFEMLKLRTMVEGSDPVGVGTVVTRDDPRVTGAGRVLRRTSLDEIPNLVNVLRGEMAIVGPRPTIPAQVVDYTPHQHRRHEVRPGITGWAQVQGRAGIPWEERIELDVEYVDHRSAAARRPHPAQDPLAPRHRPRPRPGLTVHVSARSRMHPEGVGFSRDRRPKSPCAASSPATPPRCTAGSTTRRRPRR